MLGSTIVSRYYCMRLGFGEFAEVMIYMVDYYNLSFKITETVIN